MNTIKIIFGYILLVVGCLVVLTNIFRQISNYINYKKGNQTWSSAVPIIGPLFFVLGSFWAIDSFNALFFLVFIMDPDTIILIYSLPSLLRQFKK